MAAACNRQGRDRRQGNLRRALPTSGSELWFESGLLAEFIGGNPVDGPMPFDWNRLRVVRVDGVLLALAEQMKTVLLEVPDKVAALNRHS
jgi:hypothetical protein